MDHDAFTRAHAALPEKNGTVLGPEPTEAMVLRIDEKRATGTFFVFATACTVESALPEPVWRQLIGLGFLVDLSRTTVRISASGIEAGRERTSLLPLSRIGRY